VNQRHCNVLVIIPPPPMTCMCDIFQVAIFLPYDMCAIYQVY